MNLQLPILELQGQGIDVVDLEPWQRMLVYISPIYTRWVHYANRAVLEIQVAVGFRRGLKCFWRTSSSVERLVLA